MSPVINSSFILLSQKAEQSYQIYLKIFFFHIVINNLMVNINHPCVYLMHTCLYIYNS